MVNHVADKNLRPAPDKELIAISDYVADYVIDSELAYSTARYCLMDSLSSALMALDHTQCTKLLGPIIPGTIVPHGSRVPGTSFELDPILAAFNIGTLIRWLDFNDTWLAAEWAHPSDNLGAILAVADYVSRKNIFGKKPPLLMRDVLTAMIKAYEIQGVLALENSFNRVGLDHVVLVKVASAALAMQLLGGSKEDIVNAISQAWLDGQSLRTYRHAPNTGSRKSWAAGDATSRAVHLAWLVQKGEMGCPSVLTAKTWGFYDVLFKGKPFRLPREFGSYVIENILYKISFPAEFHAQTAVECAIALHDQVIHRLDQIEKIVLTTQEPALRIINKTGPLYNYADRDHCLQYMAAAALLFGNLKAEYYDDVFANDPRIDNLREKMQVIEEPQFSKDYLDPEKRSIANSMQVFFKDGSKTDKIQIEYPLGHQRRRAEGIPLLIKKFENSFMLHFPKQDVTERTVLFLNQKKLEDMPVNEFMELWVKPTGSKK
ncbi:MAG TPA: bifunctional 2-methylcitrate dehydratase/aconitate hydratase [Gammaproteobacteria bacterium]|nr:bifunctional 2-methylcitrate dehydratase/aconitate hydratase [Gammaproteobacteria bacterium]